jgi:hypothetical protein
MFIESTYLLKCHTQIFREYMRTEKLTQKSEYFEDIYLMKSVLCDHKWMLSAA